MTDKTFDFTGYFTIVLTENLRNQYDIITKTFEDCWQLHITNVIFLVTIDVQRKTAIYTYFPYTQFHCESVAPVILNYFIANNSFLYATSPLFPSKTRNLHRCPLTVATFTFIPYIFLEKYKNGTIYIDGIDGITFRVLGQRLNFTPIILVPPNNEMRGKIYANGTMTGAMLLVGYQVGMCSVQFFFFQVMKNIVNVTIGAIAYDTTRTAWFSASFPYFHSGLVFAIPAPKQLTQFQRLFIPFRYIIWSCISTMFVIGFVVTVALKSAAEINQRNFVVGRRNRTPFVNMINICLGGAIMAVPTRNFARTMFIVWMFGCIVLRNAYLGALFDVLKKRTTAGSLNSLDELVEANYSLYMPATSMYVFDNFPKTKPL